MGMNFAVFGSYSALMTVFPLFAASVLGADGSVAEVGTLFAAGAVVGFIVSFASQNYVWNLNTQPSPHSESL